MKNLVIIIAISTCCAEAFAQFEKGPQCVFSNPEIREELKGGIINRISLWSGPSSYGMMATSTLQPAGKNPNEVEPTLDTQKKELTDEEAAEEAIADIESYNASQDWECQYSAYNLIDGKPFTAWVEGVEGDGIGEIVLVGLSDARKPLKIWTGYGKSEALFKANNRPSKVKLYLLKTNCQLTSQFAVEYRSLAVVGMKEIALKDLNAFQDIELPTIQKSVIPIQCEYEEGQDPIYFLGIEILSVYKGTRYRDTCISEIQNR